VKDTTSSRERKARYSLTGWGLTPPLLFIILRPSDDIVVELQNDGGLTMMVRFGKVAREQLDMQCQYASRYVDGRNGDPCLGSGLRFEGDPKEYHSLMIEAEDVPEFVKRVRFVMKNRLGN